ASVAAFADDFPDAPLLVTSQDEGESPFELWHLPRDIAEYVESLLRLYLGKDAGAALAQRLTASGLMSSLQSGYDVRLIADLAAEDPTGAELPQDRIALYRQVVDKAWPSVEANKAREQQDMLKATAWKLSSERGPNEDKRRLKPGDGPPKELLEALAD